MQRKLLYFHHSAEVGGASWSLYQIAASLRHDHKVSVVLAQEGPLRLRLQRELGVQVRVDTRLRGFTTAFKGGKSMLRWHNLTGLWAWRRTQDVAEQICREEKPEIVHINTFVLAHAAVGCRRAGVPRIVLHVREPLHLRPGSRRDRLIRKTVSQNVDAVLAITEANAAEVGLPGLTTLVPNWPDFTGRDGPVDLEHDFGVRPGHKILLVMGARHRHKGSLVAIRAMAYIKDPQARLLVLGGRPGGGALRVMIRRLLNLLRVPTYGLRMDWTADQLRSRVVLAGPCLNVRTLIERSWCVVCPFLKSHFAKATIEAGALGRPAIVSAGALLEESVVHEETGLVVPSGDEIALAAAMNRLLEDSELTRRLGEGARRLVVGRYDREKSLALIRQAYSASLP